MRAPNASTLAMRDPALAALMGAIGAPGSDFGFERRPPTRRAEAPAQFGDEGAYGFGFGVDEPGTPGFGFGAEAMEHHRRALHGHHLKRAHHTDKRRLMLNPNMYSESKIERYSFSVNFPLVLGTPDGIDMSLQPDTSIRPQRVVMNAPQPGMITVAEIKVANVSVTVGDQEDAFTYSALAQGVVLDMPTLSPSNRAKVLGTYTGYVPPGFAAGYAFLFISTFQGPSSLAGEEGK
jgi:hypothetical protein